MRVRAAHIRAVAIRAHETVVVAEQFVAHFAAKRHAQLAAGFVAMGAFRCGGTIRAHFGRTAVCFYEHGLCLFTLARVTNVIVAIRTESTVFTSVHSTHIALFISSQWRGSGGGRGNSSHFYLNFLLF